MTLWHDILRGGGNKCIDTTFQRMDKSKNKRFIFSYSKAQVPYRWS